jgi:hypothetical protein
MRVRALIVGLVALVAAGAAATVAAGLSSPGVRVRAPGTGAANERAADAAASRLLSTLMLPAGATVSVSDPSPGRLSAPGFSQASIALVDLHRFWRLPEGPSAVTAWVLSHPPAGGSFLGSGGDGGPGYRVVTPAYGFAPIRNVLLSRTLAVSITAAQGGGSAIRADAEVEWLIPRPRSERVPAGVRLVTITDTRVDVHTGRSTTSTIVVTDAARVRRIVGLVDALTLDELGEVSCPSPSGPLLDLRFYAKWGGRVLGQATTPGYCDTVAFEVRGRAEPMLIGAAGLIKSLDSLLHTLL